MEALVGLLVPVTFFTLLGVERLFPARDDPPRRGWAWLGTAFLMMTGAISAVMPLLLDPAWLAAHRLVDLSGLGVPGGVVLGWVLLSALMYAWHRAQHASSLLWRLFHQLHHSPQRLDIAGSMFFHPLEVAAQMVLTSVTTTLLLGLDPLAAALTGYVAAFHAMFQHLAVRTPRWLGPLIQRPEAHAVHHRMGVHAFNYGDFPLWDILLGTFVNPAQHDGRLGFESPADRRVGAMLAFKDVSTGPGARPGVQAAPAATSRPAATLDSRAR